MGDAYEGDAAEDRDRTKLVWVAIGVVFALMIVALWFMDRPDPNATLVRARHILIKYERGDPVERRRALDTITDLRERLLQGATFEELAEDYSDDPGSRATGGDLGFMDPSAFEGDFKNYVLNAPVGKLSDVISTSHGFHLVEVLERNLSDYDKREREIERRLREQEEGAADAPEL